MASVTTARAAATAQGRPQELAEAAAAGRRQALARFSPAAVAESFEAVLDDVVAERSALIR